MDTRGTTLAPTSTFGAFGFDALPIPAAIVDQFGVIHAVNPAWQRFGDAGGFGAGLTASGHAPYQLGANVFELATRLHRHDAPEAAPLGGLRVRAVIEGERDDYTFIYPRPTPEPHTNGRQTSSANGAARGAEFAPASWYRVQVARCAGQLGNFAVITVTEITDERLAERDGRRQNLLAEAFRQAQAELGHGFLVANHERLIHVNDTLADVVGATVPELLAMPSWLALFTPATREPVRAALTALSLDQGEPSVELEVELTPRHGANIVAELALSRVSLGGQTRVVGLVHDITARKRSEHELKTANAKLRAWAHDLDRRAREIMTLNEMSQYLLASATVEDACAVVAQYLARLLPEASGALTLAQPDQALMEVAATWGPEPPGRGAYGKNRCWALRRGRPHLADPHRLHVPCPHFEAPLGDRRTLCVPLNAQGETVGALNLQSRAGLPAAEEWLKPDHYQLALAAANHIALALATLRTQSNLQNQSIRDPLTGMFNRRYLEETLERELRQAQRAERPLGLIVLDIDRFKDVNDQFGHDAGDYVISEIGKLLQSHLRGGDIASRYGGEEFVLVLPGASLDATQRRAEQLRHLINTQKITRHGQSLGRISVSMGVAARPEHGQAATLLFQAADRALFRAKRQGRDQVVIAD